MYPRMLRVRVTSGDAHASLLRPHQVLVAADDAAQVAVRSHSLWRLQGAAVTPALVQLVCDRRPANDGGLCAGVVQLHAWALDALGLRDGDAAVLEPTTRSSLKIGRIVLAVATRSPLATTTTSSSSLSSLSASSDRALESAAAATYALLPESVRSGLVDLKKAVARQLLAMYGGDTRAIARGDLVPIQLMGETFVFRIIQVEHEQESTDDEDLPAMAVDVLGCHAMGEGATASIEALSSTMQDLQLTDEDTDLVRRLARLGFCGYTAFIHETLFHIFLNFPSRESAGVHNGDTTAIQSLASRGLLLHGVPGVGKSLALGVVDTELQRRGIATWRVDAVALLMEFENAKAASAYEFLQAQFRQFLPAYGQRQRRGLSTYAAGVVLIDDLHVLFQSSNGQDTSDGDQSGLLLMPLGSALLRCLDAMGDQSTPGLCIVGTATTGNEEDAGDGGGGLPPVAKRSGRFDKLIEMIVPTEAMRKELLAFHLEPLPIETGSVARDLASRLAVLTGGYVAKDLVRICRSAYVHAFSSVDRETAASPSTAVAWDHLVLAQRQIQPSQLQQLNVASPSTDVGDSSDGPFAGYPALQKQLGDWIEWKFHPSEAMKHLGVANASGLLIHGPSGCGKSLLVKALAASAKVNFVSVKSSELLSKCFGDSERAVRQLFARARAASPCLLFFDEFDAIAHKRSFGGADASGGDGSGVYARILSTFLNEMDGVGGSRSRAADVLVVAATNRMDALDAALIRPGRIDKAVELGFPQQEDTQAILAFYTRNMPLASDVDLAALASRPTGSRPFTGADLAAVCKEAAFRSLRENIDAQLVCGAHFVTAWDQRAGLS